MKDIMLEKTIEQALVKRVKELGIMTGCRNMMFCPNTPVLRREMAEYMVRAKEGVSIPNYCASGSLFSDVLTADYYCRYIVRLKQLGITKLSGRYDPSEPVTSFQMAEFISQTFFGPALNSVPMPRVN
jgi:hypothetical protein